MKRAPADIIAAIKSAYRPDAPASVELVPGDHDAIAKLEQQQVWLGLIREWMRGNAAAKRSFDTFVGAKNAEGGAP